MKVLLMILVAMMICNCTTTQFVDGNGRKCQGKMCANRGLN